MKKLCFLFLFITAFCSITLGQSGGWRLQLDATVINNRGYSASGSSSEVDVEISKNGGSWERVIGQKLQGLQSNGGTRFYQYTSPSYLITDRINTMQIWTKFDRSGAGDPSGDQKWTPVNFQTSTEKIKYKVVTYTGSSIYIVYDGSLVAYAYPSDIVIVRQPPTDNGISAEDKVNIAAPAGYDPEVYQWVYKKDLYDPGEQWKPIANSSLNGSENLSVTLADIYGPNFMDDGVVNFESNTYIALAYDVYQSSSAPRVTIQSNNIPIPNKLIAPKIVSAVGGKTLCSDGGSNGTITVTVDRPLLSSEIISFYATLDGGIAGNKRDFTQIDPTTYEIINLPVGTYTVQVSSVYGDAAYSTNVNDTEHKRTGVVITSPDPISYTVNDADIKPVTCKGGDDGSFKVTAGGGTAPYTLLWEQDENSGFNPVANNLLEITGLKAGTYRYYITDSTGCELSDPDIGGPLYKSVTITEPAESLAVSFLPDQTMEPTGNGRSDGYITAQITGGTPPYTVVWTEKTSGTVLTTVDNSTAGESKLYNIAAGTYSIAVTDSKGCNLATPGEFTLNEPGTIIVSINQDGQILCYGDASVSLSASASGGQGGPYTYIWSKIENGDYVQLSTGSSLSNIGAGDYKVSVSDNSTPPNVQEIEYSISEPPELTASASQTDIACKGTNTGSITVSINGGTVPYTVYYKESNDLQYSTQTTSASVLSITGLPAGNYTYYILDANECRAEIGTGSGGQLTITEPEASLEIISSELKNPTGAGRSDGSIAVKVDGGTPYTTGDQYAITWKKNGTVVTSVNSLDGDGSFTSKLENLTQGEYDVEIKDSSPNGCIIATSFNLTDPPPLSVILQEIKYIDCFGNNTAQLTAGATGGIPLATSGLPYTYEWYKVESGNDVLIADESTDSLKNIGAGAYKVKIADGSTPVNTAEASITVSQPPVLGATVSNTINVSCFGGSNGVIRISATGGSGGYKLYYKLSTDKEYTVFSTVSPGNVFNLINLPAGKYSLYVQDVNGCIAPVPDEVELTAPQKPLSVVAQKINTPSGQGRSDGNITVTVDGGTPFDTGAKYLVTWKDENGKTLTSVDSLDSNELFTSKISNLPKGVYSVSIKDKNYQNVENGCYFTASITLNDPPPLTVSVESLGSILCYGDNSGELVAHAVGGIPYLSGAPYKYTWYSITDSTETVLENQNDSILSGIPAGLYKVKIEDESTVTNSVESGIITISQPEQLVTSVDARMISCYGGGDGYIHISVKGGTGSYKLYYKRNETDREYQEIAGDSIDYTFNLNNLPVGAYSVYILDADSCYASINGVTVPNIVLTQPDKALTLVSDTVYDPTGYGLSNGEIQIQLDGGTPDYTVVWTDEKGTALTAVDSVVNGVFTSDLTGLSEGKYRVEVRDANYSNAGDKNNAACILNEEYELVQPAPLTLELEETHYISCYEFSDGEITALIGGGVKNRNAQPPYKLTWYREENGSFVEMTDRKDSVLTDVPEGTYMLVVEDYARIPNKLSATYQLVQPELLTAVSSGDVEVDCGDLANVSVVVTGGTTPYTYRWNTGDTTPELFNMPPGKYMVIVTDARGCDASAIARVISPSDLSISATVNDPVCYQSTNGSIIIQVNGGTAPYSYKWSTGAATKDLTNIGAGFYTVVVTDVNGCNFSESFELKDPEPIKVDLGEDIILCIGQSYPLEPKVEDPKTTFSWTGPDGFQSTDSKVDLSRAGVYRLTITDSKGCQASDDIEVLTTDYEINSDMVVATDMFVNDTIVLVNITSPDPDRIEWLISKDDPVEVIDTTQEMAMVIFKQTGEYKVGMRAFVKDCYLDVVKTLNVTVNDDSNIDDFGPTDIQGFVAYPNPNDGTFRVKVDLGKQSTIRLRLFSLLNGSVIDDRTLSGSNSYDEQYQKYVPSGVYILLLETPSGRSSQKVIIK